MSFSYSLGRKAPAVVSSGSGSSGGPSSYLGQVATRCFMPLNGAINSITIGMTRSTHFARDKIVNPLVIYPNWKAGLGSTETSIGASTFRVAVEYPAGTFTLSNENIANGGNAISVAAGNAPFTFSGVTIPFGAKFWMRVYQANPNGVLWNQISGGVDSAYGSAPEDGMNIGSSAASVPDQTMGGTVVFANGISYFPLVIASQTVKPATLIAGTSREVGDYIADTTYETGLTSMIIGKTLAYTSVAQAGSLMSQWNSGTHTFFNQLVAAGYWTHVTNEYGVNDVPQGPATTVASARQTFAAAMKALKPDLVIIGATVYPFVATSDIVTTRSGQTLGQNSTRLLTLNNYIRAGIPGEDFYWDAADGLDPFRSGYMPVSLNVNDSLRTPAVFTGSISGSTLTVTAVSSGTLSRGDSVYDQAQPVQGAVLVSTWIVDQLSGTAGGVGTYQLNRQYNGNGTYPKGSVSSRTLTTAGLISADGLHATRFGREMIERAQGATLLRLLAR